MACNKLGAGACITCLLVIAMETPAPISRWIPTLQKEVTPTGRKIRKTWSRSPFPHCAGQLHGITACSDFLTAACPTGCCTWIHSAALYLGTALCVINAWETGLLSCLFYCICLRLKLLVWFRGETRMQVTAQRCGKGRRRGGTSSGHD